MKDFRVAFFSDPPVLTWALPSLLQSGLSTACVVTLTPKILGKDPFPEIKGILQARGIPMFFPNTLSSPEFQEVFFNTAPSVIACMTLSRKIPQKLLSGVPLGGINWHPAFLPSYRGPVPGFWSIFNQEKETGVTLHDMTDEFDAGDIYFQKKIPIDPEETFGSLSFKGAIEGVKLLFLALNELKRGRKLPRIPQDPKRVSYAPFPQISGLEIQWDWPAEKISALIRAASPFLGASTWFQGELLKIWSARISEANTQKLKPGTLIISPGKTEVVTGNRLLSLETLQHGFFRYYSGAEFSQFPGIQTGQHLGMLEKEVPPAT